MSFGPTRTPLSEKHDPIQRCKCPSCTALASEKLTEKQLRHRLRLIEHYEHEMRERVSNLRADAAIAQPARRLKYRLRGEV